MLASDPQCRDLLSDTWRKIEDTTGCYETCVPQIFSSLRGRKMGSTSKTPEFTVPPNNGKRLIPTTIDEVAALDPERVFASILKSPVSPQDGYRDITFCQIANGINQVAWLLEKELGRSQTFETLAYLAPGDLRYPIVAVAAVKVGYKVWQGPERIALGFNG